MPTLQPRFKKYDSGMCLPAPLSLPSPLSHSKLWDTVQGLDFELDGPGFKFSLCPELLCGLSSLQSFPTHSSLLCQVPHCWGVCQALSGPLSFPYLPLSIRSIPTSLATHSISPACVWIRTRLRTLLLSSWNIIVQSTFVSQVAGAQGSWFQVQ